MTEVQETEKFPSSNFKPGDAGYLGDEYSGDYCEVRDILLQRSRHKILDAVLKLSPGRMCIAREHFLQASAYCNDYKEVCMEIALILTRVLAGDKDYDKNELMDDIFSVEEILEEDEAETEPPQLSI